MVTDIPKRQRVLTILPDCLAQAKNAPTRFAVCKVPEPVGDTMGAKCNDAREISEDRSRYSGPIGLLS